MISINSVHKTYGDFTAVDDVRFRSPTPSQAADRTPRSQ